VTAGFASLSLLVGSTPSLATPITYKEEVVGTGSLGPLSFSDAHVTITLVSDTANVVGDPGSVQYNYGIGTGTFTDLTWAFTNPTVFTPAAGISDLTVNALILGSASPALAGYDLRSSVSIVGASAFNPGGAFPTTQGDFVLTALANTSVFTAVPEPESSLLCALAASALFARRRD